MRAKLPAATSAVIIAATHSLRIISRFLDWFILFNSFRGLDGPWFWCYYM